MAGIRDSFPTIDHGGHRYTFEHLVPFTVTLTAQGRNGADITIRCSYLSHVFSRRHDGCDQGLILRDEAGLMRQFCKERYARSHFLPGICRNMIERNYLTWQSQDRNRISNLAISDAILRSGPNDLVIYYLFPSRSRMHDVELVVKSAYRKDIDFERIKRRFNVQQLIKKAYFQQIRIP